MSKITTFDIRRAVSRLRSQCVPSDINSFYTAPVHEDWMKAAFADPEGKEAAFLMYLAEIGMLRFDPDVVKDVSAVEALQTVLPLEPKK